MTRKKSVTEQETAEIQSTKVVEEKQKKKVVKGQENLIPVTKRTKEEARQISINGGKKSGEARRKKKELRELTKTFLLQEVPPQLKANLQRLGFQADDMTNLAAIVARVYSKSVNDGDLNASRTLVEWAGFSPMQQMQENEMKARLEMMTPSGTTTVEDGDSTEVVQIYLPAVEDLGDDT